MRTARFIARPVAAIIFALSAGLVPSAAQDKKGGPAAKYEADVKASRVFIKVGVEKGSRLGHPHGVQGNLKSGHLALGGDGELVFDMASFEADTAEARKRAGLEGKKVSENEAKKVTETMRGPEVLDVAKYPTATFR